MYGGNRKVGEAGTTSKIPHDLEWGFCLGLPKVVALTCASEQEAESL